jgi:putative NADPH-quinone reductase
VLVVHAHPSTSSYGHHLFRTAVGALAHDGRTVHTVDLYREGFEARMSAPERLAYSGAAPILSDEVARSAELVRGASTLVFVYPTWWFGLPAVMKGWLERVLVPGVAFTLDPETKKVRRNMGHVRRIVGVTTYGSSPLAVHLAGDGGRRTLGRTLRLVAHPLARTTWLGLYRMDTATAAQRDAFTARVAQRLGQL